MSSSHNFAFACDGKGGRPLALIEHHPARNFGCIRDVEGPTIWGTFEAQEFADAVEQGLRRRDLAGSAIEQPGLGYGQFYPRIARLGARLRPSDEEPATFRYGGGRARYVSYFTKYHARASEAAHVASLLLYQQFAELIKVVEPAITNRGVYGHAIRQLLILAATDVEAAFRGILQANSYSRPKGGYMNMQDYAKLRPVMRLAEWEVSLAYHEEWGPIAPFGNWNDQNPLSWYDAYHAVKHDREAFLPLATLENAIKAMAAVAIIGWAQFGERLVGIDSVPKSAMFIPTKRPQWNAQETYYGPVDDESPEWQPVNLQL